MHCTAMTICPMRARLHRRQLQRGVEADAGLDKPSGSVAQTMFVDTCKLEYTHPVVLLYYLCTISDGFRASMGQAKSAAVNNVCRVVLCSDGATPGNVFRLGKGKNLEARYWSHVNIINIVCVL